MRLINWECLEEMDKLIAEWIKVDAIITDPPYWTMKWVNTEWYWRKNHDNHDWDVVITPEEIFKRANLLLRKNGKLILFSQEPYSSRLITEAIPNIPFSYRATWVKDNFANALWCNKSMVNFTEDILIYSKLDCYDAINPLQNHFKTIVDNIWIEKIQELFSKEWRYKSEASVKVHSSYKFWYWKWIRFDLMDEKMYNFLSEEIDFPLSYLEYKEIDNKYKKDYESVFNLPEWAKYKSNILEYKKDYTWFHPTQKPVALMEDLIKTYTNEWETVLDFTAGSWSTMVWCKNTNRKWIAIELDEWYFKIMQDRLNNK